MSSDFDKLSPEVRQSVQRAAVAVQMQYAIFSPNPEENAKKIEDVLARHPNEIQHAKDFDKSLTDTQKKALDFIAAHSKSEQDFTHIPTQSPGIEKDLSGTHSYTVTAPVMEELKHIFKPADTPAAPKGDKTTQL